MARPRKDLRLGKDGKGLIVELNPVPAKTSEEQDRLAEVCELVAHFIGLATQPRKKSHKENLTHAA